jgi:hypothetical protein
MNAAQFVKAVKLYVRDSSVESELDLLADPPGRLPPETLKRRSEWFRKLNSEDQEVVKQIIFEAVGAGIFHLLCVLDGVKVIDDKRGKFELRYIGNATTLLNDPKEDYLHDLFNSE